MRTIVKTLTFTEDEINSICEAIIIAQDAIGDKRKLSKNWELLSNIQWNIKINNKIITLDTVLRKIYTTEYKGLPEPEDFQASSLCNEQQQHLPFSDL
jgi:hypothetical protein